MAADSVGQIGLDLVVNKNEFDKQMKGIQGLAKKAGVALAAAFAVKKIVDFGAQCIKLGSDLQEVQNVVDVTFPRMSKQVDEFAQNAAVSFGLSETMAKKFTGTFGAMAKAFGFGEQQAYEMATALTGLSGDVASFYNISQDEAYTKLKSVFTGETESLKDLGVVMTQAALDQYALANGYGKTVQAMTEAEKVALRYKFVTDQLSGASGDFLRTSDGWANQIRVLQLQFDSLKATIGQGLINVLTPVIKVINTIIGKLMSLANAFKAFTELITGKKGSGGGASVASAGMEDVAESADHAGAAMGGAGGAAKKAAKDIKGAATGIDELNIIQAPDDSGSGSGGSGGGAGGGYAADEFDMGEIDTSPMDELDSKYQGLIDRAKELAALFQTGFKFGFGDTSVFDTIQTSIESIGKSLRDIFTDARVVKSAKHFADLLAFNLGRVAGSVASIGATIADNLLGGISLYLESNSQRIKDYLVTMFDIGGEITNIIGSFTKTLAEIFSIFRSDTAKQITADIIQIFSDGFWGAISLALAFGRDILDLITGPIIENADKFKESFNGLLDAVQTVTSGIAETFQKFVDGVLKLYNEHVSPLIQSVKDGLSEIVGSLLDAFNTHILPVIQYAAERFTEFNTSVLQPLIEKFLEFAGKVTDAIKQVWERILQPFIKWFIENVAPIIAANLRNAVDAFFDFLEKVGNILSKVIGVLSGLIDFLIGVFTGDWKKIWNDIKRYLASAWDAMKSQIKLTFALIYQEIKSTLESIKAWWELIWTAIKDFCSNIWESIKSKVSDVLSSVQTFISDKINAIKAKWDEIWTSVKETVSKIWDSIKEKVTTTIENVRSSIEEKITAVKAKWDEVWGEVKKTTEDIFGGIWDFIKGIINNILSGVEIMANGVVRAINKMIDALNNLSFDIPDWVPEFGGKSFGLDIPTIPEVSIPRLAKGGFVKANTPQLAMIGDNRHYGEIVAPEDKMQAMVDQAVAMASANNGMSAQYLIIMIDLLKKIIELIENLDLTVTFDTREIKKKLADLEKRSGYTLKTT